MIGGRWIKAIALAVVAGGALAGDALAADGFTRADYDLIMRWVNFLILAAIIYRFGRKPILAFLSRQRSEVADSIEKMELKRQEAQSQLSSIQKDLAASQQRLSQIKERILADGQNRKEQIIAEAREESRLMLEQAHQKIKGQFRDALARLRSEMVDEAVEIAATRLPSRLKAEDHERLLKDWLEAVAG